MKSTSLLLMCILVATACGIEDPTSEISEYNWWPVQPVPEGLVIAKEAESHGENALLYSIAGHVAAAQKNGEVDELVWIEVGGEYPKWYSRFVNRIEPEERGEFNVWELLDRYKDVINIEGYILYNPELNSELRDEMDFSYNIAVSYAGVENAIIIDESLESEIQMLGYTKILDAREISRDHYFKDLKNRKNRDLIVTMNPSQHNNMDFAIANNALVFYDTDEVTEEAMEWVNPISPVVGWNHGDEYEFTIMATKNGLFNTASDHANNLITLSAGAEIAEINQINSVNPGTIDFDKKGHFHSFLMSDGDNMQWTIGSFLEHENYWGSSFHGDFPMGFTSPSINLSLMAPDVLNEFSNTQPEYTTVIEYGPGGYQYPDQFASDTENREEVQREYARRISRHMNRAGVTVLGFISVEISSEDAMEAYQIYAEEIDNLTGMLAVQYAPYHGGDGEVFWMENRDGVKIPVVTSKYSLWQGLDFDERGGDIQKVADIINKDIEGKDESMEWTAIHSWSEFKNPADTSETAIGVQPLKWTIDQMNDEINIVSPEELIWRIRMKHYPEQTSNVIR